MMEYPGGPSFQGFIDDIETSLEVVAELEEVLEQMRESKSDDNTGADR